MSDININGLLELEIIPETLPPPQRKLNEECKIPVPRMTSGYTMAESVLELYFTLIHK